MTRWEHEESGFIRNCREKYPYRSLRFYIFVYLGLNRFQRFEFVATIPTSIELEDMVPFDTQSLPGLSETQFMTHPHAQKWKTRHNSTPSLNILLLWFVLSMPSGKCLHHVQRIHGSGKQYQRRKTNTLRRQVIEDQVTQKVSSPTPPDPYHNFFCPYWEPFTTSGYCSRRSFLKFAIANIDSTLSL